MDGSDAGIVRNVNVSPGATYFYVDYTTCQKISLGALYVDIGRGVTVNHRFVREFGTGSEVVLSFLDGQYLTAKNGIAYGIRDDSGNLPDMHLPQDKFEEMQRAFGIRPRR